MARRQQMVDELRELKVGHIRKQRDRDLLDRQLLVLHSVADERMSSADTDSSFSSSHFSSDSETRQKLNEYKLEKRQQKAPLGPIPRYDEGVKGRHQKEVSANQTLKSKTLIEEINSLRQKYLLNGGNSRDILLKMAELEVQALANEKSNKKRTHQRATVERSNDDVTFGAELSYNRRLRDLEFELELTRREAELDKLRLQLQTDRKRAEPPGPRLPEPSPRLLEPSPRLLEPSTHETQPSLPPADVPQLLQHPNLLHNSHLDRVSPGDSSSQFHLLIDFVAGLDASVQWLRLVVGFVDGGTMCAEPVVLPTVMCETSSNQAYYNPGQKVAIIHASQAGLRRAPSATLGAVLELQCSCAGEPRVTSRAWCVVPVFSGDMRLRGGRWRVGLRLPPIDPTLTPASLTPQFGSVELFCRLVTGDHGDHIDHGHTGRLGGLDYIAQYRHVGQTQEYLHYSPNADISPSTTEDVEFKSSPPRTTGSDLDFFGIQVDRLTYSEPGFTKVKLSVISQHTGKTLLCSKGPVTCCTTAVADSFRHRRHIFGRQEASFPGLAPGSGGALLVAKVYLVDDGHRDDWQEAGRFEERLIAWSVTTLMRRDGALHHGTRTLRLYEPPLPHQLHLVATKRSGWRPYGDGATLRVVVYSDTPQGTSLGESEGSEEDVNQGGGIPQELWLPHKRRVAPSKPFGSGDGIILYIDGCRNLPDAVTVTTVAARVMDRAYVKVGEDMVTGVKLDSDIHNPIYEYRTELQAPSIPATATLLLKVYTINSQRQLAVAGFCTINLFVELGTETQPSAASGLQVSLNEGAHQLRLYRGGPDGRHPLSRSCLHDNKVAAVPCATLLLRVFMAPLAHHGGVMQSESVPRGDWEGCGLWHPRPHYSHHVYYSASCRPSHSECLVFHALHQRAPVSVRDTALRISSTDDAESLDTDVKMEAYIRTKLTRKLNDTPVPLDWTILTRYDPKYGIKCRIQSASNLPWTNFTQGQMSLSPPGAFYMGYQQISYDVLHFTHNLHLQSVSRHPVWTDKLKHYPNRTFQRYLTLVIHLQEISVSVMATGYKYNLTEQAWTALDVFNGEYVQTGVFKMPLFHGAPTPAILQQLAEEPLLDCLDRNLANETLLLIENASVTVTMCDARRYSEVENGAKVKISVSEDYLPGDRLEGYATRMAGHTLRSLVPEGKSPATFVDALSAKYKKLVYKVHDAGNGAVDSTSD